MPPAFNLDHNYYSHPVDLTSFLLFVWSYIWMIGNYVSLNYTILSAEPITKQHHGGIDQLLTTNSTVHDLEQYVEKDLKTVENIFN